MKIKKISALLLCTLCLVCFSGAAFASNETPAETAAQTEQQNVQAAVQNVQAISITKKNVTISWDPVPDATKYIVYSAKTENGKYKKLSTVKKTEYTHKIKLGKTTRYYTVCAVVGGKTGPSSSPLSVSLSSPAPVAEQPSPPPAAEQPNALLDAEYSKVVNASYVISGLDQKYLDALNADRKQNGAGPLKFSAELTKTAMIKAADMHKAGVFYGDHNSPIYGMPSAMGQKYLGYPIAENIMDAAGPWQQTYADAADCGQDQFMNSPSHRATRLDKSLTYVGFAMYYDGERLCICEHYSQQ